MRSTWVRIGWAVLLVTLLVGPAAWASSLFGTSYDLGDEIRFKVQDSSTWWWGCCACEESLVLGWRIETTAGQVVYSVIHDAPVSASIWQGSWLQTDINGMAVIAGQYRLVVDTSVGTLSKCFSIKDPCACTWCRSSCVSCVCQDVSTITNCSCRTSLVFVDDCTTCGFPLFQWGCSTCNSGCSTCP